MIVGCNRPNKPPPSLADVKALICGKYQGRYNKGTEYFEIRSDGTFSQAFIQAGVTNYGLEGKWNLENMADRYLVRFTPFMDLEEAILHGKNPEKVNSRTATFFDDESRLFFIGDLDYFIVKLGDGEATKRLRK
jgi:hypothetical protein